VFYLEIRIPILFVFKGEVLFKIKFYSHLYNYFYAPQKEISAYLINLQQRDLGTETVLKFVLKPVIETFVR